MRTEIKLCKGCHNISDTDICDICANQIAPKILYVSVEDNRDVMCENTNV
jgi:recombination protein RecR